MRIDIGRVPTSIIPYLRASDIKVLNVTLGIFRARHAAEPRRALYITPSEAYIAARTGLHRCTVSRSIKRMQELSLLVVSRRRREGAKWKTNLIAIGTAMARLISGVCKRPKKAKPSHVLERAHNVKTDYNIGCGNRVIHNLSTGLSTGGMAHVGDVLSTVFQN